MAIATIMTIFIFAIVTDKSKIAKPLDDDTIALIMVIRAILAIRVINYEDNRYYSQYGHCSNHGQDNHYKYLVKPL